MVGGSTANDPPKRRDFARKSHPIVFQLSKCPRPAEVDGKFSEGRKGCQDLRGRQGRAKALGNGQGKGLRDWQGASKRWGTMSLRGASCNAPQEVSQRSERAVFGEHFCPECVRKVMKSVLGVVANSPFGRG
jgi:hypothetical protein